MQIYVQFAFISLIHKHEITTLHSYKHNITIFLINTFGNNERKTHKRCHLPMDGRVGHWRGSWEGRWKCRPPWGVGELVAVAWTGTATNRKHKHSIPWQVFTTHRPPTAANNTAWLLNFTAKSMSLSDESLPVHQKCKTTSTQAFIIFLLSAW
jgi:hypothetical protein